MKQRRSLFFLVGLLTVLMLAGCAAAAPAVDEAPVSTGYANPDVLVNTEWVLDHLDDENVRIVDVSSGQEVFDAGHLPGAVFIDWRTGLTNPDDPVEGQVVGGEALAGLLGSLGITNDQTIVVYDDTRSLFATRAYWVLKYYGHEDVRVLDGGSGVWTASGQALTDEVIEFEASDYTVGEPDDDIRAVWGDVVAGIEAENIQYADARSPDEYLGADVRSDRGGHVPGAINLEWANALNEDGTFKSAEELEALYADAGFAEDSEVIAYCQTGVRAAHTWFVLHELLGYENARNYDGSWQEYGNNPDSPIDS